MTTPLRVIPNWISRCTYIHICRFFQVRIIMREIRVYRRRSQIAFRMDDLCSRYRVRLEVSSTVTSQQQYIGAAAAGDTRRIVTNEGSREEGQGKFQIIRK